MSKVFILGLPRTGTTSICATLLSYDFKVAHTAYSKQSFVEADVIADAPVFCDYVFLDKQFPNSKFIYLARELDAWLPSIQLLLSKLNPEMLVNDGGLNPVLKRCYRNVFQMKGDQFDLSEAHLEMCFLQHRKKIEEYFSSRSDLLQIELSSPNSLPSLCSFLGLTQKLDDFPTLNEKGKINAWKKVKHSLKISSSAYGPDRRRYFDIK